MSLIFKGLLTFHAEDVKLDVKKNMECLANCKNSQLFYLRSVPRNLSTKINMIVLKIYNTFLTFSRR